MLSERAIRRVRAAAHRPDVDVEVLNQRLLLAVGRHTRLRFAAGRRRLARRRGPDRHPPAQHSCAAGAALPRARVVGERAAPPWLRVRAAAARTSGAATAAAARASSAARSRGELNRLAIVHERERVERQCHRGVPRARCRRQPRGKLRVIERRRFRLRRRIDEHELVAALDGLAIPELRRALDPRRRVGDVVHEVLSAAAEALRAIVKRAHVLARPLALGRGAPRQLQGKNDDQAGTSEKLGSHAGTPWLDGAQCLHVEIDSAITKPKWLEESLPLMGRNPQKTWALFLPHWFYLWSRSWLDASPPPCSPACCSPPRPSGRSPSRRRARPRDRSRTRGWG